MDDTERFVKLINGGYCCISIVTYEEQYALEIVRQVAMGLERELQIWSVAGGVREGLVANSPFVADTEAPAVALCHLAEAREGSICATLDLAEHLNGSLALRALRDPGLRRPRGDEGWGQATFPGR